MYQVHRQRASPAGWVLLAVALLTVVVAPSGVSGRAAVPPDASTVGHLSNRPGQGYTNATVDYNSSVDGFPLSYSEILPLNYSPATTYPLAVELHGISPTETTPQRGGYPTIVYNTTANAAVDAGFILLVPNTRTGTGFYVDSKYTGPQAQDVLDAIAHEKVLRHIGKVYLYGFSMGSFGALSIGLNHPGMFAGLGAAAAFSDDFELENHLLAINSTALAAAGLGVTGGQWPNASAYARGIFAELSPLRWHPTNASGTPIYVAAGGDDIFATNNPALSSYEQANDTVLQSTCQIATAMAEPPSCTVPLAELAALDPANYSYRYVYEPNGPHDYALLNATDLYAFFDHQVPDGTYWGFWPTPTPGATPTPLLTIATSPMTCGDVEFAGTRYAAGTTIGPPSGTYNVTFDPCAGTTLSSVVAEGGVTFDAATSTVTLASEGALVAYFATAAGPTYDVQLASNVACDAVVVNGTAEAPNAVVLLPSGVYPILAQPCGTSTFHAWSTGGSVSVTNASAAVTELTVHGNGTLTVTYSPGPPPPTIVPLRVVAAPSNCGPVSVGGQFVASGATVELAVGSYNISALACSGYNFVGWSPSSGVTVQGSGAAAAIELTAGATLTAVYALGVGGFYDIAVSVVPGACGAAVDIGGIQYSNLSDALLAPGNYALSAEPCAAMSFVGWSSTGGVTASGGALVVGGNGTLTARYTANQIGPGNGSQNSTAPSASLLASPFVWAGVGALLGAGAVGGIVWASRRRRPPGSLSDDDAGA